MVQISFGLIGQYCMVHQGTKKVECVSVRGMNEQSRIVLHTWSAYHSVAVTGMARYTCIARNMFLEVRNCLAFGLLYQSVAVRGMARGQFRATTHHRITKALSSIYWNVVFCCLVFEMSAYYQYHI